MRFLSVDKFQLTSNEKITAFEFVRLQNHGETEEFLYVGSSQGRLFYYNVSSKARTRPDDLSRDQTHSGQITCLKHLVDTDGKLYIVSGSSDHTIKLWLPSSYQMVQTLYGHEGTISSIDSGTDGTIISCSIDGLIKVWSKTRGRSLMKFPFYECSFTVKPIFGAVQVLSDVNAAIANWVQSLAIKYTGRNA